MKVFQIYFDEESKSRLEPQYIPVYNNSTTVFFESKIMCDLIDRREHLNTNYFGVVSHHLRKKVQGCKFWGRSIANRSVRNFSAPEFEQFVISQNPDIASYSTHPPHAVFPWAERYHPGICKAIALIISKLRYRVYWDRVSRQVIYFNYFVAKPKIYEDFVRTLLKPAISLMIHDPQVRTLVSIDSRYQNQNGRGMPDELKKQIGFNYYPLHPFICERLINLYLLRNRLKFIQW